MNLSKHIRRLMTLGLTVTAVAILWLALSADGDSPTALAQTVDTPTSVPTAEQSGDFGDVQLPRIEGKLNPPQYPNMDSNLNRIVEQVQTGQFTAQAAAASAPIHREESVAVTLYLTEGYAQDVWDWLEDSGASPRNIGIDYIEAYVPVSLLPSASEREGVISVRTIIPPQPAQGVVVSEGAAAHGAPAWHATGLKGQGVKIGIIDAGYNGFQSLMGTELPSTVEARCYTDLGVYTSSLADCENGEFHGAAVTEAAFDIAPEATYYIASIPAHEGSNGDVVTAVRWMIEHDVDVINMSLAFTWEGPGDGTTRYSNGIQRSVDTAVANGGITWVSAAGNSAQNTWYGSFADSDSNGFHNFTANDECNVVELLAGEEYTFQLRWDDRWGGANRDLDLYLFLLSGTSVGDEDVVAGSADYQTGGLGHDPFEYFTFTPIDDGTYCLGIESLSSAAPSWIQLQAWGVPRLQRYTLHHSIANPAASANSGLLAVGAAGRNGSIDNPFDTSIIEPFSSQGPTTDGRIKPDIVGADAGQSATYRSQRNPNGYFFGTSQASPHVAGLAALVKQNYPGYTPQQIANYLKTHAEERGEAGADNVWGHGFAHLLPSDAPTQPTPNPSPSPSPTASPQPSPTSGRIAFNSDRDGNYEIYAINADGSGVTRLTNNPARDVSPAWSPDGNRIAFVTNRDGNLEIYVMNADGSGVTRLTNNSAVDDSPAWSPDGNRIAFYSTRDGVFEIYVMNADGSGVTRLTNDSAIAGSPAWSPDGNLIAFDSARDGNQEIYVMNADGSGVTRLTNNPARDVSPAWSPDGNRIAFHSNRDRNYEIYAINADGSGVTRLTNNSAFDGWPAWSPDGNRIAFASNSDGNYEIYVMNADGSGVTRLTNNSASDYSPAWLPVGEPTAGLTDREILEIFYNATNGANWTTNRNWLSNRPIEEWWGVTTDASGRVIELILADDNLDGTIPAELGNLSNLRLLILIFNDNLTGEIPAELGNLSSLDTLHLLANQLTGAIPPELGNLSNLGDLDLSGNQLTGEIPAELGNLSNLEWMSVDVNQLNGAIPSELGNLSNLRWMGISSNQLTGTIPSELGNLSNLRSLYLDDNQLTSALPQSFTNLTALENFAFSGNAGLCAPTNATFQNWLQSIPNTGSFAGVDPLGPNCATGFTDSEILEIFYNATNGANWTSNRNWLSDSPLGDWHGVTTDDDGRVTELHLPRNNLTGTIPVELGNLSNLQWLGLSYNQLSGTIPPQFGNLSNLKVISLTGNRLTGPIPSELGNLTNLESVAIAGNELAGTIPSELGRLSDLKVMYFGNNALTGTIPPELGSLSDLTNLELWGNDLSGTVPNEIGNLDNLTDLHLYDNGLTGPLPQNFVNLTRLEVFNFGGNNGLCAPTNATFQNWLQSIPNTRGHAGVDPLGPNCEGSPSPSPSATRSFSSATVEPGGELAVTIAAADYGSVGGVTETLPPGFAYVSQDGADRAVQTGQEVKFTLQGGDKSFSYVVTASSTEGTHSFSGTLVDENGNSHSVGGATTVTVGVAPPPNAQCVEPLPDNGVVNGTWWEVDCESTNREAYARYYTFTLEEASEVTMTLESWEDTYLYLLRGAGISKNVIVENDNYESDCAATNLGSNTDSCIAATLDAGDYTIEAATLEAATTGDFTLTVKISAASQQPAPPPPPGPQPTPAPGVVVSAGPNHACALDTNGEIACQGVNDFNQVSDRPTSSGFVAVSVGDKHSCAIDASGSVDCWGSNEYGQSSAPSNGTFLAIGAGDNYTCALRSDNNLECWGRFEAVDSGAPTPPPLPPPGSTPAPDVAVDQPTVSDSSPTAGASFTLNATVRNRGDGAAGSTTLRYFQSTDSSITTSDTEVGTASVNSLSASGSSSETISLTAPSTPGTYYYGACVDAVSGESDTGNNCSTAVAVTVGAAPPPIDDPFTIDITNCSGTRNFISVDVEMGGTVTATRDVSAASLTVTGTANGSPVDTVSMKSGRWQAGETQNWSMSGTVLTSSSTLRCEATLRWSIQSGSGTSISSSMSAATEQQIAD